MNSVRLAGTIAASGLLCATVVLPAASSAAAASALPASADSVSVRAASAFPASAPAAPGAPVSVPAVSVPAVSAPGVSAPAGPVTAPAAEGPASAAVPGAVRGVRGVRGERLPEPAAAPGPGSVAVAADERPSATDTGGSPNTRQIVVGVCLAGGAVLGMAGLAVHRRRAARPPAPPREWEDPLPVAEPSRSRGGPPGVEG